MQVPYEEVDVERTASGDEPGQDPCFPVGEFGQEPTRITWFRHPASFRSEVMRSNARCFFHHEASPELGERVENVLAPNG